MAYAKLNGKYIKRNNKPIKVDASIDSNIKPENIKKDVEILGVTGILESGGSAEPTKSWFYVTEYDSNGYIKAKTIGCSGNMPYIYGNYVVNYPSVLESILKEFEINDGVTSISSHAFRYCKNLTSITLPNTITSIGSEAFYACTGLTSITLPNTITSIGTSAFYACSGLTSITLPNEVTTIGKKAFMSCTYLETLTILATTPPTLGTEVFANCYVLNTIYIPKGTLDAYSTATNWTTYASRFVELSE